MKAARPVGRLEKLSPRERTLAGRLSYGYANLLVALLLAYGAARIGAGLPWEGIGWGDLAFLLLTVILFLGSRDALRKYYARTEQLLGGSREKSAVPANERGAWPGSTIDADISRETGWK